MSYGTRKAIAGHWALSSNSGGIPTALYVIRGWLKLVGRGSIMSNVSYLRICMGIKPIKDTV